MCAGLVGRKPRRADRTAISIASFAPGLSHVWITPRCSLTYDHQRAAIVEKSTLLISRAWLKPIPVTSAAAIAIYRHIPP